jgi:nucleoside-diphosphate-sugar epimerase
MAKSKILVLGGTQMLGRDFVETLLEKDIDYDLVLANRGITNSELFNNLSKIQIDRNIESECNKLNNSQYDYVIDFSCYTIDQFKNTINNLKYKKYIYISTMSVFDQNTINKKDINDNYYWYCVNKKQVEEYIISNIKNILIVRPCAIFGEHDYTQRFYKKNDNYYFISSNTLVNNVPGYMFIKEFTKKLLSYIDIDTSNTIKIVNILS